jgi:hypothetical protein
VLDDAGFSGSGVNAGEAIPLPSSASAPEIDPQSFGAPLFFMLSAALLYVDRRKRKPLSTTLE